MKLGKGATGLATAMAVMAIVMIAAARCCAAGNPVNMTEANRSALSSAVEKLRRTELQRVSRGRVKSSPIPIGMFTLYQDILHNQGAVIGSQKSVFENSLVRLDKVFATYPEMTPGAIRPYFMTQLIDSYDVTARIESAATILDVWQIFKKSECAMEALPARAALAANAEKWLARLDSRAGYNSVRARMDELLKRESACTSPMELSEYIDGLSADYARLWAETAVAR